MNLLLISKTSMAIQIFKLISKKLDIEIEVQSDLNIENDYDLIVIDSEYIDDDFNNYKKYSKKLGAISKDELTFDKSKDFLIPRPFLPSQLENILRDQIELLKTQNYKPYEEQDEEVAEITPALDYIETLAEDVARDISFETEADEDESIIKFDNVNSDSVLDKNELNKIKDILSTNPSKRPLMDERAELTDEDWLDLSQIIDNAIDEIKGYDFPKTTTKNDVVNLILKEHNIENLKPLFYAIDQSIVDKLTKGEEVIMRVKLKED